MTYGQVLKRCHVRSRRTIAAIADDIGVSPSTIHRWFNGQTDIMLHQIEAYAVACGYDDGVELAGQLAQAVTNHA